MEVKTALILVGGEGKRLWPLTKKTPKPLISIDNDPIVYWILRWLNHFNITNIVLCIAYKPNIFKIVFKNTKLNLRFSKHLTNDSNSIAIEKAIKGCDIQDENFLVINGDTIAGIDIDKFFLFHKKYSPLVSIATTPLLTNAGVIDIDSNKVIAFQEKPLIMNIMINSGYYIFNRQVLNLLDNQKIEVSLFSKLVNMEQLYAFNHNGFWYTIDTYEDLINFEKYKTQWNNFKSSITHMNLDH